MHDKERRKWFNLMGDPDDAPELTDELLSSGEVFRGETFVRRADSQGQAEDGSEHVSVRLDRDVLARLREAGPGWQSRVNGLLRASLALGRPDAAKDAEADRGIA